MECKKIKFDSKEKALIRLNNVRKTSNEEKIPLRVYKCSKCDSYHFTSMTKKTQQVVKKRNSLESRVERLANYWIEKNKWNTEWI
jgi:hypothetical protein